MRHIFIALKKDFNLIDSVMGLNPATLESYSKNDMYFAFICSNDRIAKLTGTNIEIDKHQKTDVSHQVADMCLSILEDHYSWN